jgi:hypothetical protein
VLAEARDGSAGPDGALDAEAFAARERAVLDAWTAAGPGRA